MCGTRLRHIYSAGRFGIEQNTFRVSSTYLSQNLAEKYVNTKFWILLAKDREVISQTAVRGLQSLCFACLTKVV